MYIKQSYLAGLGVVAAGLFGWMLHGSTEATDAAPAAAHAAAPAAPAAAANAPTAAAGSLEARPGTEPVDQPPIVLSLTINSAPSDDTSRIVVVEPASVGGTPPTASAPAPTGTEMDSAMTTPSVGSPPTNRRGGNATGLVSNPSRQVRSTPSAIRSATGPQVRSTIVTPSASVPSRIIAVDTAAAFPAARETGSVPSATAAIEQRHDDVPLA